MTEEIARPDQGRHGRSGPIALVVLLVLLLIGGGTYLGVSKLTGSSSGKPNIVVAPSSSPGAITLPTGTTASPNTPTSSSAGQLPVTPALPTSSAPGPAPPPFTKDPGTVVSSYFAAINARNYALAWSLGGDNIEPGSYDSFVQGFASTANDSVAIVSVVGDTVTVTLDAAQTDGTHRYFAGTYTVRNGVIVSADVH